MPQQTPNRLYSGLAFNRAQVPTTSGLPRTPRGDGLVSEPIVQYGYHLRAKALAVQDIFGIKPCCDNWNSFLFMSMGQEILNNPKYARYISRRDRICIENKVIKMGDTGAPVVPIAPPDREYPSGNQCSYADGITISGNYGELPFVYVFFPFSGLDHNQNPVFTGTTGSVEILKLGDNWAIKRFDDGEYFTTILGENLYFPVNTVPGYPNVSIQCGNTKTHLCVKVISGEYQSIETYHYSISEENIANYNGLVTGSSIRQMSGQWIINVLDDNGDPLCFVETPINGLPLGEVSSCEGVSIIISSGYCPI